MPDSSTKSLHLFPAFVDPNAALFKNALFFVAVQPRLTDLDARRSNDVTNPMAAQPRPTSHVIRWIHSTG